ncbi:MAG: hypothetical protein EBU90_04660 [Proteobacteria bacterium]|nr:hypothetical protein [Pseudomonadota bacterium]NBP13732.1 hypothetical protein [bacterium]
MNQKIELTKYVLNFLNSSYTEKELKKIMHLWWWNTRNKSKGGWRLTELGFFHLNAAQIKSYEVKFEEEIFFSNELVIWIDQNIDCPFYITDNRIWVFNEKTAVQLVLFSGNIQRYHNAKKRWASKEKLVDKA